VQAALRGSRLIRKPQLLALEELREPGVGGDQPAAGIALEKAETARRPEILRQEGLRKLSP